MTKSNLNWHSIGKDEIFKLLESNFQGLTSKDAEARVNQYGKNIIPQANGVSAIKILLRQFFNPLILILIFATCFAIFIHEYTDAIAIVFVVIINTIIGFWQEIKAEREIESLKHIEVSKTIAVRDGKEQLVNNENIVPGDIIILTTGSKVGADARIIEAAGMRVDESILTGESVTRSKNTKIIQHDSNLADRKNMIYSGCLVSSGRGKAIVVATGANTEIGKIAKYITTEKKEITPLQKKINQLAKILAFLAIILTLPIVIFGIVQQRNVFEVIELAVSLAVSAVPEGLPVIITVTLALGIRKMFINKTLIRRLPVVEVLGSVDVICTDKTGTLTTNEMTVKKIYAANQLFTFEGDGFTPEGKVLCSDLASTWGAILKRNATPTEQNHQLNHILTNFILCNDATPTVGDPTEMALVIAAMKNNIKIVDTREKNKRISEIPFSSDKKYMITQNETQGIIAKGAVEEILKLCNKVHISSNKIEPLDENNIQKIKQLNDNLALEGLRVLGTAYLPNYGQKVLDENEIPKLIFLGIAAMMDPPREDVKEAIESCKSAGIRVLMITGDHAVTAQSIARKVGIDSEKIVEGKDLDIFSEDEISKLVENTNIFARVTSEHKLIILKALQQNGHIVGMGGDGVNDAPAIKRADIGFSVGSGTDLTKEVSDMVLLNDSFATLPKAVKEGRVIYHNIQNFFKLLIASNFDEIFTIMFSIILKIPLLLAPIHILWINLLSDGLPSTALATDTPAHNVMRDKPRNPTQSIFANSLPFVITIAVLAFITSILVFSVALPWWNFNIIHSQMEITRAQTMVFAATIFFEMIVVFIIRTESFSFNRKAFRNKYIWGSVLISITLLIAAIQIPLLNNFFKTSPLSLNDWLTITVISLTAAATLEILKLKVFKK